MRLGVRLFDDFENENRWISLRLTNAALRTIDKKGIDVVLAELRANGERV